MLDPAGLTKQSREEGCAGSSRRPVDDGEAAKVEHHTNTASVGPAKGSGVEQKRCAKTSKMKRDTPSSGD